MNRVSTGSDSGLSPIRRQAINQWLVIVNGTLRNKLPCNFNKKKQKCIRKYRLRSGGHFVEGGDELNILLNDWRELSQILLM